MKTTAVFLSVFFLFLKSGPVHTPWPRLGGGWQSESTFSFNMGTEFRDWAPLSAMRYREMGCVCVCLAARLLRMYLRM